MLCWLAFRTPYQSLIFWEWAIFFLVKFLTFLLYLFLSPFFYCLLLPRIFGCMDFPSGQRLGEEEILAPGIERVNCLMGLPGNASSRSAIPHFYFVSINH